MAPGAITLGWTMMENVSVHWFSVANKVRNTLVLTIWRGTMFIMIMLPFSLLARKLKSYCFKFMKEIYVSNPRFMQGFTILGGLERLSQSLKFYHLKLPMWWKNNYSVESNSVIKARDGINVIDAIKSNRNVIDWNVIVIDANVIVIVIDWKVIDFLYYFFYYFLLHCGNLCQWQIPTNILTSVHSKWISLNI